MTAGLRYRRRLGPRDMVNYLNRRAEYAAPRGINRLAHNDQHPNNALTYTSKATLDTVAGSPIYPPQAIRLIRMFIGVAGNPASTLTCDLLLNGVSVFPSGWDLPTIPSGQAYSNSVEIIGRAHVAPLNHDYLQVQLTATGSATGPLVATIEYRLVR